MTILGPEMGRRGPGLHPLVPRREIPPRWAGDGEADGAVHYREASEVEAQPCGGGGGGGGPTPHPPTTPPPQTTSPPPPPPLLRWVGGGGGVGSPSPFLRRTGIEGCRTSRHNHTAGDPYVAPTKNLPPSPSNPQIPRSGPGFPPPPDTASALPSLGAGFFLPILARVGGVGPGGPGKSRSVRDLGEKRAKGPDAFEGEIPGTGNTTGRPPFSPRPRLLPVCPIEEAVRKRGPGFLPPSSPLGERRGETNPGPRPYAGPWRVGRRRRWTVTAAAMAIRRTWTKGTSTRTRAAYPIPSHIRTRVPHLTRPVTPRPSR